MRTQQDIRNIISQVATERLTYRKAEPIVFTDGVTLAATGLDSLDMVEVWLELEERLGWQLSEKEVRGAITFGDLVRAAEASQPAQ